METNEQVKYFTAFDFLNEYVYLWYHKWLMRLFRKLELNSGLVGLL
ncbi:MAG: hypothetical protein H7258_08760 [Ferruginibacter sp.]|nr:hypothetical protein [Ferruginibacter sp.]